MLSSNTETTFKHNSIYRKTQTINPTKSFFRFTAL